MNFLKVIWRKWLPVAQAIGNFQAQVILTIFYIVLLWPLGLIFRLLADPLRLRSGSSTLRLRSGSSTLRLRSGSSTLRLRSRHRQGFGGQVAKRSNFEKWEHPRENLEEARKQY